MRTYTIHIYIHNTAQIDLVKKGDTLILRNATIQMSKSRMYVKIDQWGLIEKCKSERYNETINTDNNISDVEWELVAPSEANARRP